MIHPQRQSPRADFHDYSGGTYFITICTRDKQHYFGEIRDAEMHLNSVGEYCEHQLKHISTHYPYAEMVLYVIMPNHIHFIVGINRTHEPCVPTTRTPLSVVIGGLKRDITLFARKNNINFAWQSRYHDHIIRGMRDGKRITEYIRHNVAQWSIDCFYSEK